MGNHRPAKTKSGFPFDIDDLDDLHAELRKLKAKIDLRWQDVDAETRMTMWRRYVDAATKDKQRFYADRPLDYYRVPLSFRGEEYEPKVIPEKPKAVPVG